MSATKLGFRKEAQLAKCQLAKVPASSGAESCYVPSRKDRISDVNPESAKKKKHL